MKDLLTELKSLCDNPDSIIEVPKLIAKLLIKVPPESHKRQKKSTDQSSSDFSVNKDEENKFKTSAMYPVLGLSLIHI